MGHFPIKPVDIVLSEYNDVIVVIMGLTLPLQLFLSFCKSLDIKHSFSSAYDHGGYTGERAVCIIKNIMKKCAHAKTNWRLGLLENLCTPLSEKLSSPAELLATHQYRGLQPTLHAKLLPHSILSDYNTEQLII